MNTRDEAASDWATKRGDRWRAHLAGMEGTLGPVDEPLLEALQLDAPYRIAEVGCGGGGTTLHIAARAPEGSIVHGFDVSPGLVEVARGRAGDARAIRFDVADMGTAAPDGAYDRLASRFGVMFFADPGAAFANLVRWLAPGGRFAFAVWGPPAENPWMTSARDVVGRIVTVPPVDPEAPGPFRYADAGRLLAILGAAGFAELGVREWRGALPVGGGLGAAEAARFALSAFAGLDELLASAGHAATREAHDALTTRFAAHATSGAVRVDACVRVIAGVRA